MIFHKMEPLRVRWWVAGWTAVVCHIGWLGLAFLWGRDSFQYAMALVGTEIIAGITFFIISALHPELVKR